jgi:uncharacterized DUF497 family protein
VEFAWDERKNLANQRKHRIGSRLLFRSSMTLFICRLKIEKSAANLGGRPSGMVKGIQVVLVAHTVDEDPEAVRILSARKAIRGERNMYAQGN